MHGRRAASLTIGHGNINDHNIADPSDVRDLVQPRTQRARDSGTCRQHVDIDTAWPIMSWRLHLCDMIAFARPADAPSVHLADTSRPVFANHGGELLVAKPAAGG